MHAVKDGDLYKTVEIGGVTFRIYYGYSTQGEKENGWEPRPLYPEFLESPQYTKNGEPFATVFQDVCEHFQPKENKRRWCEDCLLFEKCEKYIGICKCDKRKREVLKE